MRTRWHAECEEEYQAHEARVHALPYPAFHLRGLQRLHKTSGLLALFFSTLLEVSPVRLPSLQSEAWPWLLSRSPGEVVEKEQRLPTACPQGH